MENYNDFIVLGYIVWFGWKIERYEYLKVVFC